MTAPQQVPAFDASNGLLAETPAQLTTALLDTPAGQRMALTIRTPSTTLTVLLDGGDAKTWGANISRTAGQMSGAGLVVAAPAMPLNGKAGT